MAHETTVSEITSASQKASESFISKKIKLDEFKDISERLTEIKEEYSNLCRAVNEKNKELRSVQNSIDAHEFTLHRMNESFDKEHAEKVRVLENRQKEVTEAGQEYQWLLKGVRDKTVQLEHSIHKIAQDKLVLEADNKKWQIYAGQAKSDADVSLIEVSKHEALLKEERQQFEAYKLTLQPLLDEIIKSKGDNTLLIKEVESKSSLLDKKIAFVEEQRQKMLREVELREDKIRQDMILLEQKEDNLVKRNQELEDYDLELKARTVEVEKQIVRYQLNKTIESGKKKG